MDNKCNEGGIGITRVDLMRLAIATHQHLIRLFLPPGQGPLGTVDLDEQIVFSSVRDLAGRDGTQCTIVVTNHGVTIIVQCPPIFENFQVARNLAGQQPRHIAAQVECMSADVAKRTRSAGLARIRSPCRLFVIIGFQSRT